jgi:hypothetical protein
MSDVLLLKLDSSRGRTGAAGPMGVTGAAGVTGPQGSTGGQGVTGPAGAAGLQGVTGLQGAAGSQGVTGLQGAVGSSGAAGSQGVTGLQGATGPAGAGGGAAYQVYVALLGGQDYSTDPPVATVLENTLGGEIVWSVLGDGQYLGTLTGGFDQSKTVVFYPGYSSGAMWSPFDIGVYYDGSGIFISGVEGATVNNCDSGAGRPIEIRVYP